MMLTAKKFRLQCQLASMSSDHDSLSLVLNILKQNKESEKQDPKQLSNFGYGLLSCTVLSGAALTDWTFVDTYTQPYIYSTDHD